MSKYTPENVRIIIEAIEQGADITNAMRAACLERTTYYYWKENHPEFAEAVEEAIARRSIRRLKTIELAGLGRMTVQVTCPNEKCRYHQEAFPHVVTIPSKSWQALAWLMERQHPEEYALRGRIDLTGRVDHRHMHLHAAIDSGKKINELTGDELISEIDARIERLQRMKETLAGQPEQKALPAAPEDTEKGDDEADDEAE